MKKDYYEILGITEEEKKLPQKEFADIVKKKYRKIAIKYHPDKFEGKSDKDKKDAEEKFKEASEAYSVLSDEAKRREYEAEGADSLFDLYSKFGGTKRSNKIMRGESIHVEIVLTLKEAYNGGSKDIFYYRDVLCDQCDGTGSKSKKRQTCPDCGGLGEVYKTTRTPFGMFSMNSTCETCGGKGYVVSDPCPICKGTGLVHKINKFTVHFSKGVNNGGIVNYEGQGNCVTGDKNTVLINGNLYVHFKIENSNGFELYGSKDIKTTIYIGIADALLGIEEYIINCIDDKKIKIKVKELTKDGQILRFKGKGMPDQFNDSYGDMFVEIKYKLPEKLTDEYKKVLNDLKRLENEK